MIPRSTRTLKPLVIRISVTTVLFIGPSLYLQFSPELWKSTLQTSASHSAARFDIHLRVTGFSHASHSPQVRIAVCITGQLRSFSQLSLRQSIKRHLLAPLRDTDALVHVFFHVGHSSPHGARLLRVRHASKLAELALQEFQPVRISYFSEAALPGPGRKVCSNTTRTMSKTYPPALLRAEQCLDLIAHHEKKNAKAYDWIYKTRPDVAFGSNISVPSSLRNDTLYMNQHNPGTSVHAHTWLRERFGAQSSLIHEPVGDHIFAASREVANVAFRAKNAFRECELYTLPHGTLNSEVGLTYWLSRTQVRYKPLPWFWMLVREDGPECQRVQWIRNKTGLPYPSVLQTCLRYKETGKLSALQK